MCSFCWRCLFAFPVSSVFYDVCAQRDAKPSSKRAALELQAVVMTKRCSTTSARSARLAREEQKIMMITQLTRYIKHFAPKSKPRHSIRNGICLNNGVSGEETTIEWKRAGSCPHVVCVCARACVSGVCMSVN